MKPKTVTNSTHTLSHFLHSLSLPPALPPSPSSPLCATPQPCSFFSTPHLLKHSIPHHLISFSNASHVSRSPRRVHLGLCTTINQWHVVLRISAREDWPCAYFRAFSTALIHSQEIE